MTQRNDCRSCGSSDLSKVLSLGKTPLANSFLDHLEPTVEEPAYALDLYYCRTCHLLQVTEVVPPEIMFSDYIYVSGTSTTISRHNRELAKTIVEGEALGGNDLVVEIGSNDGSLLQCFKELGVRTLGIDPAGNIAEIARQRGIDVLVRFFNAEAAKEVLDNHGSADAICANNVLAHVDDTPGFLAACANMLNKDGVFVAEVPYVGEMLDKLEYDTIYHEHLCYFSVTALMTLYQNAGLSIEKVDMLPVHGGSLRVFARNQSLLPQHADCVLALAAEEAEKGMTAEAVYHQFSNKVAQNRSDLRDLLKKLKADGKSIAAYGASAKGNTLLNYCRFGPEDLDYIADKSPYKVGKFSPGSHIPVKPVEYLLQTRPDYLLLTAWNFKDEILEQQKEYLAGGGRFIIPIPSPCIVP